MLLRSFDELPSALLRAGRTGPLTALRTDRAMLPYSAGGDQPGAHRPEGQGGVGESDEQVQTLFRRRVVSRAVWPMPVSVEQIAVVVRRMSSEERLRLVELAPELKEALAPVRTLSQAKESARMLQEEMLEGLGGELLRADEAFLGGLVLEEYWNLPDRERARLWTEWAEKDWDTIEEVDVSLNTMPAG